MTMTQPPQPEPLDESERKLARALRELPVAAPPAELDALILAAARRAAQAPTARRERRWVIGLASAASAVLAVGLLLRLHGLNRAAQEAAETAAPAASTIEPPPPPAADARSSIETKKDSTTAETAGGPANAPAATDNALSASQPEGIVAPRMQAPEAFPAPAKAVPRELPPSPPPPPPVMISTPTPMATPVPPSAPAPAEAAPASSEGAQGQTATAETDAMARRDAQVRQESATAAAFGALSGKAPMEAAAKPSATMQTNEPVSARALDKAEVSGSRLKRAGSALPPLADDAKLDADAWIARIRARLAAGERNEAVSSLKSFMAAHPDVAIPNDLRALLH